jgi:hypothetical protein
MPKISTKKIKKGDEKWKDIVTREENSLTLGMGVGKNGRMDS